MRRHGHVDRRIAGNVHALADRRVVRIPWLQVDVVTVPPLDDIVFGIAALADKAVALKADVHVTRDKLGPVFRVGIEDRFERVCVRELDHPRRLAAQDPWLEPLAR